MQLSGPKAESVLATGEPDGWQPEPAYFGEVDPSGDSRLVASVGTDALAATHAALLGALTAPLSLLYRLVIDRRAPRPQGAPPRDFVAVELPSGRVAAALEDHGDAVYHDARAEVWVRDAAHRQVVLDQDGVLYAYPDHPDFRAALAGCGLQERQVETLAGRDYVKHWFHVEADAHEDGIVAALGLSEMPPR